MTTIYLSSTYEDLKEYREVVCKALRKSGYDVIAMEDYVAADQRPVDKCLADVAKVDIYVGVFAFRYGYVPPVDHGNPKQLSITELEFRQAESLKKPCLTFCVSENKAWPPIYCDAQKAEDKGERVNRLRQYVLTEKTGSAFSDPHELASLVQAAVANHLKENYPPPVHRSEKIELTWDIVKDGSPYPGLLHFSRKYAPVFFGRDAEISDILDRMRGQDGRFIIISGDSGVGKSSVVAAGILPRLENGALLGGESAETVRMVPGQGNQPFNALMTALGSYATRAGLRPDEIAAALRTAPGTLAAHIRKIVPAATNGKSLVLFLDQMEELFTAQDVEESNKFLTALYGAAQEKALWVMATIRSDHLHFCHRHSEMLSVLKSRAHYPLGNVEPYMMYDMIMKPAKAAGLKVSESLAKRIINDTQSESANLPLVAFVLDRLFEKRSDHELSENTYKTIGGVSGAIAEHVATVERKVPRDCLQKIFHSLVIVKEEGLPTRNRPLTTGFSADFQLSLDVLVKGRLLRTEGEGEASTVSIAHEKLFEAWPALRDYIATNKKALMDRSLLEARARKWLDMGRPWFSGLASKREVKDFRKAGVPTSATKNYLRASNRAWWIKSCAALVSLLIFVVIAKAWQEGLSVDYTWLKVKSSFTKIHKEPEMIVVDGDELRIKRFALGKYEVTFDEYDRFALATRRGLPRDEGWGRGLQPVINVSWEDAQAFANWLSAQTGKKYRLPSEAEWEYAARSGGKDQIWAGTSDEKQLSEYAVFAKSRPESTRGTRKPNGLGLHDMSGNVWEWAEDCWDANYEGVRLDGKAWKEENGGDCGRRVLRGGSWSDGPVYLRSSARIRGSAGGRNDFIGFRLAQDLP